MESDELSHALNVSVGGSVHTGRVGGQCAPWPFGSHALWPPHRAGDWQAAGLPRCPGVLLQRQSHGDAAALAVAQRQEKLGQDHWSSTLGCSTTPWEVTGKK